MRESLRRLASDDAMAPRSYSGRVRVELLTGDHITIDVARKANGAVLLDKICDDLDILEKDYFGLLHVHRGDPRVWVDLKRRLSKTFRNEPWEVKIAVKFYPPEPSELKDDTSRYQLGLAIRRDLIEGRLNCSTITYALLASYVLQAELGDREGRVNVALLTEHRAVPLPVITPDLEDKIDELYRKHKGQTPAEAELNYLENAKKLPLYGAELHSVKDSDDVDIVLAVCANGISVLRDGMVMNRFPWAKILKISYNKRTYTLRLRASEFDEFETHVSFKLSSSRSSKQLWRCSVEHHIFFRRSEPVSVSRVSGCARLGSRRVSCRRTLRQLREPPAPPAPPGC
ncbi:band 4.1-like protein 3 [Nymphalis io]|uniref:band 4.1-like protein 3 n=1 Tax=Inachis io TaxID=171585 RepID=UPI002168BCD7|nr:band 4.1-like protein 3 [Nymphalis io]